MEDFLKELERESLRIKGEFFLSPRERLFLDFIREKGIPKEIALAGIRKCYGEIPPRRRSRYPLFLCLRQVMETYEEFLRKRAQEMEIDWERIFKLKLEAVKELLESEPPMPGSEEEAEEILKEVEKEVFNRLWGQLNEELKREIVRKFRKFRREEELFKELVKEELRKIYRIPVLSLYVDSL